MEGEHIQILIAWKKMEDLAGKIIPNRSFYLCPLTVNKLLVNECIQEPMSVPIH